MELGSQLAHCLGTLENSCHQNDVEVVRLS